MSSTPASRRRRGLVAALVTGALALSGTVATAGVAGATDGGGDVVSIPVSFTVKVENRATPCDPLTLAPNLPVATIRGTLTGPKKAIEQGTVTGSVLSHGDGYDQSFWTFPDKRYDVAGDLAKRGHVSVSYDRLGYGRSDRPNGNSVCIGTEATVLRQIVDQLRAGTYTAKDTKPAFTRVGVVGHSASGFIVEQMQGVLGGADAVGAISTGVEAVTPLVALRAAQQQQRCLLGPNDGNGYAGLEGDDAEFRADHLTVGIEPAIADVLTRNRTRDACAGTRNLQSILANTVTNAANVRVPVLAVAGTNDAFFPNVGLHAASFTSSPKVTVKQIPATPHAIAFSGNAPLFRDTLAAWLTENGL